jgi:hypothetical protein
MIRNKSADGLPRRSYKRLASLRKRLEDEERVILDLVNPSVYILFTARTTMFNNRNLTYLVTYII